MRGPAAGGGVRRRAALVLVVAAVVLAVSAAVASGGPLPGWEERVFRLVEDLPLPYVLVWPVMQLGNVLAVPAAAAVALAVRRARLAAELLVGGLTAYVLARVLKDVVDRGRPAELLPGVLGVDDSGRGYPSGHAAVAVVLACLALPHLSATWRRVVLVAAGLVGLARVDVGAHLPLDVVGGTALGVLVAAAVLLVPRRSRAPGAVDR